MKIKQIRRKMEELRATDLFPVEVEREAPFRGKETVYMSIQSQQRRNKAAVKAEYDDWYNQTQKDYRRKMR